MSSERPAGDDVRDDGHEPRGWHPSTQARSFRFDPSINLGHVISMLILLGALLSFYNGITARMARMEQKVELMWTQFRLELRGTGTSRTTP